MRRRQTRTVLIAVLVFFLIFIQLPFARPFRDGLRRFVGVPSKAWLAFDNRLRLAGSVLFTINDLAKENSNLQQQQTSLQAQIAQLQAVKGENEQLRKDLNFSQANRQFTLLPAEVIGFSPTGLQQSFTINRGSRDGLKENQAVVSSGFLVGKVKNVSTATAEVWLLTNRDLLTPVTLAGSQVVGILHGSIRGLVLENIPLDTKVTPGELTVTSALEGLYPAGIAVGTVEEIISAKEEIFLTLRISSPISLSSLTTVFVITNQ